MKDLSPDLANGFDRRDLLLAAAVFGLACAARLLYLFEYSASPYWDALIMDPGNHWELARRIASGQGMGPYAYFRAPLYLYALAGAIKIFGESLWAVRLIQALLGGATAALCYRLARFYLARPASLIAGLLYALSWTKVYFDGELVIEGPFTFLCAAGLILLVMADQRKTFSLWLAAGLCWGLAAIARPNALVFAQLVVPALLLRELIADRWDRHSCLSGQEDRHSCLSSLDQEDRQECLSYWGRKKGQGGWAGLRPGLVRALIFGLGVAAPVGLVTARNLIVADDFVPIASQGGVNFWIGNNESADGRTVVPPFHSRDIPDWYKVSRRDHPFLREEVWLSSAWGADEALRARSKESAISDYWYGQAFAWMRDRPGAAARRLLTKCLFLVQAQEVSNNRDLEHHRQSFLVLRGLSIVSFGMIAPFVLAGAALALCRPRRWLWPLLFLASYSASIVLFFVTTRYRVPMAPAAYCLAGFFGEELYRRSRARRDPKEGARGLVVSMALLVVAIALVHSTWPKWNDRPLRSAMRYNLGIALVERGKTEAALAELDAALEIKPEYPEAWFWKGRALEDAGRLEPAIAAYEESVRQAPELSVAHFLLHRACLELARTKAGPEQDALLKKADQSLLRAHALDPKTYPAPDEKE